ncbi:glutamyl-tRNA synthetase [Aspergillus rambellii]|uniref:Glutamate--tRNA ligase, mitochondrial n=1 Tax=Aspergillus rambellii TaxID=308745 RepID=A0A0F8U5A9_9EURO|nr:glutamyl-tRNA synthetase [Aspergillus rambellii]
MRSPRPGLLARRSWTCLQCRHASSSSPVASNLRTGGNKKTNLPEFPARTRFAPSPTGYLHLGSLRTALFNYLLAKRTGGQFLLRIEDTDQKRTIPGAEQRLYEDLQWAGLQWDEGPVVGGPYGPYRQSERTALYRSHADDLIQNGHAYRCFCSADRLDAFARHRSQAGLPPGYDRKCADISPEESAEKAATGETHVVRLKVEGYPMFEDLVYGKTGQNRSPNKLDLIERVYDDPILLKSDGHPTYHLANVVDDHCMKITHVIRGTEWMSSTPLHVALYNAFKWTPPRFGHVPLLVDKSGQKLSKRNADIDLTFFKDKQGIFPETLVNFAALLGWSHTQKSDVFGLEELEQIFNLKITRGNTVVAFEKLWFLQKAHAQRFAANGGPQFDKLTSMVSKAVQSTTPTEQLANILQSRSLNEYVMPLLQADAKSFTNASEFVQRNFTFFTTKLERPVYTPTAGSTIAMSTLHTAAAALCLVPERNRNTPGSGEGEEEKIRIATEKAFKKELYHYLRWALSAGAPGPGIPETMQILGRAESVRRLQEAMHLTTTDAGARSPNAVRRAKARDGQILTRISPGWGLFLRHNNAVSF